MFNDTTLVNFYDRATVFQVPTDGVTLFSKVRNEYCLWPGGRLGNGKL